MSFPKIEGYVVTEKLGSGSYSTVYKAYTKVGARSVVAIKCVDKSRVKHSGAAIDNLITEIRLLKTLAHPHIVTMKHFTWDDKNIYIIMEYCCGGDLSKYIQRYGRVPEKQVLYFLQQLASALKFLREKGVVHMDLKPHNLLLHKGSDGKYILKVADFGFASHMAEGRQAVRGSPLYMAPEMLRGEYDARVDLWSVGVIMYECLFGRAPYSSATFKELVDKIQSRAPIQIPRNSSVSPGCADLLTRLLQHDPDQRISYEEFFAHEYLDLDHMPSRENYEKAVALIKQAIELDAACRLQPAFEAYRDSLRYLLPCVHAEPDADRRSALTAKLTRYMERAEEIKQFLKDPSGTQNATRLPPPAPHAAPPPPAPHAAPPPAAPHAAPAPPAPAAPRRPPAAVCCAAPNSLSSTEFSQYRPTVHPADSGGSAGSEGGGGRREVEGREERPQEPQPPVAAPAGRFNLRRLFGKNYSVPYLTDKDSSMTDDSKQKVEDGASDGCRIT